MYRKYAANTETVNVEWLFIWSYRGYVPSWRNKKRNYINQFDWSFWPYILINYILSSSLGNGLKNLVIFSCLAVFKNSNSWYSAVALAICVSKIRLCSIDGSIFIKKSQSSCNKVYFICLLVHLLTRWQRIPNALYLGICMYRCTDVPIRSTNKEI